MRIRLLVLKKKKNPVITFFAKLLLHFRPRYFLEIIRLKFDFKKRANSRWSLLQTFLFLICLDPIPIVESRSVCVQTLPHSFTENPWIQLENFNWRINWSLIRSFFFRSNTALSLNVSIECVKFCPRAVKTATILSSIAQYRRLRIVNEHYVCAGW